MKYFMMAAMLMACGDKEETADTAEETEETEEETEETE